MKKIVVVLLICIFLFPAAVYAEEAEEPEVNATGAVLMDFDTGRILWEKNADTQMPMASTTKIMTAIITLENADLKDVVTVSKRAASAPEVKMYLTEGEEIRLEDLLYALMLQSSNDAAIAIAEHVGGSVEDFCDMMTKKAQELGAYQTSFKTPNGLDADGHYTTAKDLAVITQYALQNEEFVRIINTPSVQAPVSGGNFKPYYIANKNRLLQEYDGAFGVKTGFTGKAGQCFVGAAKRDDMTLISVVLASGWGTAGKERKWTDTKNILNYGFKNFSKQTLIEEGAFAREIEIAHGKESVLSLYIKEGLIYPLGPDEMKEVRVVAVSPDKIEAPVQKGEAIGYVKISLGEEEITQIDLVAGEDIARHDFPTSLGKIIDYFMNMPWPMQEA